MTKKGNLILNLSILFFVVMMFLLVLNNKDK